MKKYIYVFMLFLIFMACINVSILAAEIKEYPEEILLFTEVQDNSINQIEEYIARIELEGVSPDDILEITFESNNREDFNYMNEYIRVKYRTNDSGWSAPKSLNQLLRINFEGLDCSQDILLELKFLVPQSIKIRKGVYSGEVVMGFV